jgi:hypothetical protein
MAARAKEGANRHWIGLGRPAWAHPGPAHGLLCLMSVPKSSRCFPLLHVGPCRQFLSELDITPCLARFDTFLVWSSEFVIFSGSVPGFLESSLLHCMTCTGFKVLSQGVLGNSGKPVTLETLSLTKFSKHVFQGQGVHDFRKPGTCEASNLRMCEVRES